MTGYLHKVKKLIRLVVINLVILVLLLAVVDPFFKGRIKTGLRRSVVLREHYPIWDEYYTPSVYDLSGTENLASKAYRLRTNNNGFIIGENDDPIADSADIIFFGGSTTECLYVEEDQRFPCLAGEILRNKNSSAEPVVLNGGTSGNCSSHSTINLLVKGIHLSPKIVVFMHNINDLQLLLKTGDYHKGPQRRTLIFEENQRLDLKQRLFVLLRSTLDLVIPNISRLAKKAFESRSNTVSAADEWIGYRENIFNYDIIESKFERSVLSFIHLAKSQDIEVVLMTQFGRLNPADEFVRRTYEMKHAEQDIFPDFDSLCCYYNRMNQKIRDIADEEDLLLIDLAKEIPADSLYIYDMVHLNTNGSTIAAGIIAEQLQNRYYSIKK